MAETRALLEVPVFHAGLFIKGQRVHPVGLFRLGPQHQLPLFCSFYSSLFGRFIRKWFKKEVQQLYEYKRNVSVSFHKKRTYPFDSVPLSFLHLASWCWTCLSLELGKLLSREVQRVALAHFGYFDQALKTIRWGSRNEAHDTHDRARPKRQTNQQAERSWAIKDTLRGAKPTALPRSHAQLPYHVGLPKPF